MKRARFFPSVAAIFFCCSCATSSPPQEKWELLVPPLSNGPVYGYDNQAPISRWQRLQDRSYASAGECQADQASLLQNWHGQQQSNPTGGAGSFAIQIQRLQSGQCVSMDDPRLLGN